MKENILKYRLGLDLGTNSIGWCMLRLNKDNEPVAVIKSGVRIFHDGRNEKTRSRSDFVYRTELRERKRYSYRL